MTTLRRDGYKLTEAQNGREALDAMRAGGEDLVLLDLMMPEVSGWEVLRVRKETPSLRGIPVIVISANHGLDVTDVVSNDICGLLPKPFELSSLHELVRTCLLLEHGEA